MKLAIFWYLVDVAVIVVPTIALTVRTARRKTAIVSALILIYHYCRRTVSVVWILADYPRDVFFVMAGLATLPSAQLVCVKS